MDTKRLHEAIKELRAELDRVNLAIERIEAIAAAFGRERQTGDDSSEPQSPPAGPARDDE